MTAGEGLLELAASVNAARNFRMPDKTTSARLWNFLSSAKGNASIAAVYMCIAASERSTMIDESPSSDAGCATSPQFSSGSIR
jgi:hypothetical protein